MPEGTKKIGAENAKIPEYKHDRGFGKFCTNPNMPESETTLEDWNE